MEKVDERVASHDRAMIYAPPMRIFLTGATGYVGGAVLDALVKAGHDVTALVRDNEKARRVGKRGGHPIVGNLAEPESYKSAADAQDGYIHTAYDRPSGKAADIDRIVAAFGTDSARRRAALVKAASDAYVLAAAAGSVLFDGIPDGTRFYFVHSYALRMADASPLAEAGAKITVTDHGEPFAAAVELGVVSATQFHPEKSGDAGATVLANWLQSLTQETP